MESKDYLLLSQTLAVGGARQPHIIVAKDDDDSDDNEDNDLYLGNIYGEHIHDGFGGAVFDGNGSCPTINTCQGGNRQPMVAERERERVMR